MSRYGEPGTTGYGEPEPRPQRPGNGMLAAGGGAAAWGAGLHVKSERLPAVARRNVATTAVETQNAFRHANRVGAIPGRRGQRAQTVAAERTSRALRDSAHARSVAGNIVGHQHGLRSSGNKLIAAGAGLAALGGLRREASRGPGPRRRSE